ASASSSSMISLHSSMHSSQMYTPGPAMSLTTCFWLFPQKEHLSRSAPSPTRAILVHLSTVHVGTADLRRHFSSPGLPGRVHNLPVLVRPAQGACSTIRPSHPKRRPAARVS